jgi:hypothetical protein
MTIEAKLAVTVAAAFFAYRSYSAWTSRTMESGGSSAGRHPYEPTVADVLVTKAMLTKALTLPPEIVDTIVDLAEYWPHTTTEINSTVVARGNNQMRTAPHAEDLFLVCLSRFYLPCSLYARLQVCTLLTDLGLSFALLPLVCTTGSVSPTAQSHPSTEKC